MITEQIIAKKRELISKGIKQDDLAITMTRECAKIVTIDEGMEINWRIDRPTFLGMPIKIDDAVKDFEVRVALGVTEHGVHR